MGVFAGAHRYLSRLAVPRGRSLPVHRKPLHSLGSPLSTIQLACRLTTRWSGAGLKRDFPWARISRAARLAAFRPHAPILRAEHIWIYGMKNSPFQRSAPSAFKAYRRADEVLRGLLITHTRPGHTAHFDTAARMRSHFGRRVDERRKTAIIRMEAFKGSKTIWQR